jgi:hypothetical protein
MAVIKVDLGLGEARTPRAPVGAHVVNGRLFFVLLDGSTVSCDCIRGEMAEQVRAACAHWELISGQ